MKTAMVAFVSVFVAAFVVAVAPWGDKDGNDYVESIEAYRADRLKGLKSDTGWLAVAGFHWLEPGENTFGSGVENRVALPEGGAPTSAGVIRLIGDAAGEQQPVRVEVEANPGVELRIDDEPVEGMAIIWTEADGAKQVSVGRVTFWVIPRGGRFAIRVRDLESPLRTSFKGFEFYDIDPDYRVEGRLEPFDERYEIEVPNIMGYTSMVPSPGRILFELGGESCSLLPMIEDPENPQELFFVFEDKTSGTETYAGGRSMYADLQPDGSIVLDFNKAYNPPCAYNPNTTCPLPPEGNRLPIALRVGEKDYKGHEIPTRYPGAPRIVAIGDVHGDLGAARSALRLAGAIDEKDTWVGGELVVVQTGDQLDRGDEEQAVLDLFARLVDEAAAAGGAFHVLNGNHELMNVRLDLRYVTPGGFEDFQDAVTLGEPDSVLLEYDEEQRARVAAFRPGGPYALMFAERNTVVIVGDNVFAHGGVLPAHVEKGLEVLNEEIRSWILGHGPNPMWLHKGESPTWTRIYSLDVSEGACDTLTAVLESLSASRMIVGHTIHEEGITSYCGGKVWCIDVGMAAHYGGEVEVLEIVGDSVRVLSEE